MVDHNRQIVVPLPVAELVDANPSQTVKATFVQSLRHYPLDDAAHRLPRETYRVMSANQARFRVATMARVLGVSPSGYYAWRRRPPSARARADAELRARVQAIHGRSRGTYGAPRIHAELTEGGVAVSRKRVARVMRSVGVAGVSRRRGPRTTRRNAQARPAPDRVERRFEADAPNRLWVADITYVPTLAGFLYLAIVLDVFSRRVVGWAMAGHLRTALVVEALEMAVDQRRPEAVIHHSDQGCQYTSLAFGARCRERGVALSMGSVGDCFDCEYDRAAVWPGLTPASTDFVSWR